MLPNSTGCLAHPRIRPFMAQGFDGVKADGFAGREIAEYDARRVNEKTPSTF